MPESSPTRPHLAALAAVALALLPSAAVADSTDAVYRLPPQELVDIVDSPMTPWVLVGPDEETILLMDWTALTTVEELAEEELRLAGLRIKPQNNGPSRVRPFTGIRIQRLQDRSLHEVTGLPDKPRLTNVRWSPSGRHVSFTHTRPDGIELWVVDVGQATARRLTAPEVSLTHGEAPAWIDDQNLLFTLVPAERGLPPQASRLPTGPVIQENLGAKAPARTFQDLLASEHDEALFDYHLTTQLARVDLTGKLTRLGEPAIYWDYDPSPDGRYLLVETLHRPYSYLVPAGRFPRRIEVWDAGGKPVRQIVDRSLQEQIPIARGSVPVGPRDASWRADAPATVVWAEAQDGGDAGRDAEVRDQLVMLDAPFKGDARQLATFGLRFGGVTWGRGDLALATEWFWQTRRVRVWRLRPDEPEADPALMLDRSWEDRYSDPGAPDTRANAMGREVLKTSADGKALFLIGDGASPEGDRPFLDRYDLESGETRRLFRSEAPFYEEPVRVLDEEGRYLLTRRESVDEVPNYFVRDLEQDRLQQITQFPHPTPQLRGLSKELIQYQREDGVQLSATLYLPPGYEPAQGPLPMVLWAYPREFKSASAAGQVDDSPYRFDRLGWWSSLMWLTQGYAVLDDPKMPIIGEQEVEPNDSFRRQLVASAKAAVDEVVRRGVARPGHISIGGHSYGAFMTANLLAHSDLFAAGVAQSGAYNRTLTPFGFQSEERTLWEAPEVYFSMSPFMHADKVNEPILLVHGQADNNPGTFPMQSERFYNALKGHGATARLVMLPFESHGYAARESILHLLWETHRWLEQYVDFDAQDRPVKVAPVAGAGDRP